MVTDPFPVEEIPDVFPIIKPFIERLYLHFGGYSPHAIKRLLEIRAATLHIVGDEGFFIAQWSCDKCHVLAAASMSGHMRDMPKVISDTTSYIKQHGCNKITFTSTREGWNRTASRMGFHAESITYAKDI